MGTPGPLRWLLVVLMVAVSCYHLARLVVERRRPTLDVDLTHIAMGLTMVVMLVGGLAGVDASVLAIAFAGPTVWFLARATHRYVMSGPPGVAAPLDQAVGSAAMVYMLAMLAVADRPMAGMATPAAPPLLSWLLVGALLGACVPRLARPSLGAGCRLAMVATASYMLLAI